VRTAPANIVFDISSAAPALLARLAKTSPRITESLETLRSVIPLPSLAPKTSSPFYRLPFHNRSFCYALQKTRADGLLSSDVLVFKGAEPMLPGFARSVRWMRDTPFVRSYESPMDGSIHDRIASYFPLREGKVPGVLTLNEARDEAKHALRIHLLHLATYGELAPIPLPLLIHEMSPAFATRAQAALERHLPARAFERCKALMAEGIATYIYYFPVAPLRVGDAGHPLVQKFLEKQRIELPPATALVQSWVRLFVRLLYLRQLPFTASSAGLGCCFDPGNATVINGGCCDLDSVLPLEESPDLVFTLSAVDMALAQLAVPVDYILSLEIPGKVFARARTALMARMIEEFVGSEARPGLRLVPEIRDLLLADSYPRLCALGARYQEQVSRMRFAS
jgi:hypothetical protein